ncbi:MAG: hypothetical protein WED85_01095 [Dehalococcoidia bacterium]
MTVGLPVAPWVAVVVAVPDGCTVVEAVTDGVSAAVAVGVAL